MPRRRASASSAASAQTGTASAATTNMAKFRIFIDDSFTLWSRRRLRGRGCRRRLGVGKLPICRPARLGGFRFLGGVKSNFATIWQLNMVRRPIGVRQRKLPDRLPQGAIFGKCKRFGHQRTRDVAGKQVLLGRLALGTFLWQLGDVQLNAGIFLRMGQELPDEKRGKIPPAVPPGVTTA